MNLFNWFPVRLGQLLIMFALCSLFVGMQPVAVVHAAEITVDTTDDELNADGDCSLREAIQSANTDTAVDGCVSGAGDDVITVPAGTYTFALAGANEDNNATGDLDITSNIIINGAGARNTIIDGNALDRVFHLVQDSNATLTLNGLTITNGNADNFQIGGGIWAARGNTLLSINASAITNNKAGNWGAGIATDVTPTEIRNSTISGNSDVDGGIGIFGAGIYANAFNATYPSLTIINSTFSNNDSGAGGFVSAVGQNSGDLIIKNSTFTGNVGGDGTIDYSGIGSGTAIIENTIITNNTDGGVGSCGFLTNPITGAGNLIDDPTNCGAGIGDVGDVSNFDTTLQNNGGPTDTHALLAGSNAIDTGANGCDDETGTDLTLDQRGAARPFNGTCDIGAYEYRAPNTQCTLTTGVDTTFGDVTLNFSAIDPAAACVTVEEMGGNHLAATTGIQTGNWWYISTDATSFTTDMTVVYNAADGDTRLCKNPGVGGGAGWDCAVSGFIGATSVSRDGITEFSDWAVGQLVTPLAVTMQDGLDTSTTAVNIWLIIGFVSLFFGTGLVWRYRSRA